MDERAALSFLTDRLSHAGDDAAVVDGQVLTTDMLHETTDFPAGTTRYTAGWRSVGASLSDVAAMGAEATAAVAVYAAPEFDDADLGAFVAGASEVCEAVGAEYVGGDLDESREFTAATTALGRTDDPVLRSGANPGERVCVTGTLGRTGAALELFERGAAEGGDAGRDAVERANDLFRFEPRVEAGRTIASHATAMMDSSDGLARSLHQLAEASDCGFSVRWGALPVDEAVREVAESEAEVRERSVFFGEDFELVFTVPERDLPVVREASPTPVSVVGEVTASGVEMDGETLPDRGYTHGGG
ncbi:thiamine-phosphate kinase [Halorussus sp. MSC15.2]|uniref:thiamine-phosphate kinase n=1 Tax=Halorussus sp. MSC15.2 TaxID=2283638 RepID=UPI0013D159C0|nr:thiamine-phosphate kinase [Halorussus sp. MSC15.2]NEU55590.1 thiamine-phosphate kinase [Halorussus sp. MSC15.2]